MDKEQRRLAFRQLANDLTGIDRDVYEANGQDPLEPIIGEGDPHSRIAIFGRDPGRDEVKHQQPFVGAGGQKVRAVLHEVVYGEPMPDFEASLEVGKYMFWANTVPYKPIGNKAWSEKVKKQFQPIMMSVLLNGWHGADIITLGREAFLWFGIGLHREQRAQLMSYWQQEDRFTNIYKWQIQRNDCIREIRIHPLPHPSPLNATWYKKYPELLRARLKQLDLNPSNWLLKS